ncbi:CoA-binding protein [bacterium]|nr:MAG: CoA-binding protein [bacterium]
MKEIEELLKDPDVTIAIVGANNNPSKFGNVIYRDLKRKGYKLFPVNPSSDEIDGDKAFANLAQLPQKPAIVNFVTPPAVTLKVLEECLKLGLTNVWLQPGSESPAVMTFIQEKKFNYLANACIMVESRMKL